MEGRVVAQTILSVLEVGPLGWDRTTTPKEHPKPDAAPVA
jgi:hypothetical protein